MRLFVRIWLPWRRAAASGRTYVQFETVVRRIRRGANAAGGPEIVEADVELPAQYLDEVSPVTRNADGTFRAEALVKSNRRSLAAFLASGDQEWDVSPSRIRRR
ncbi:hypothetical protein [Burkholderia stagnalis]|uniref:hypothetical protein n=1 Tax=Burkholderia stagnalis TaxID=1503054 RepID=UPI0007552FA5|nr:hypothetical protein [Burkholderia stagnalis]KVL84166.1 hypothetical protein WT03_02385 [Burkholderia stagnalis]KVL98390.1 hypothetical protein WT02_10155 [Burkholderia stagnalis]KVM16681.1 hypothetical protein WT04_03135 [Burkholderia stagnalis]KVX62455.1 hypothetical protein WT33_14095 [Burkholderia stagnalis]